MTSTSFHTPVMLARVIEALRPGPRKTFLDGTVGGGGHAGALLERTGPDGLLIGLDVDDESLTEAGERLARFGDRARLVRANFADMKVACENAGIAAVDGVLLDLGGSSHQFDTPERGFSFREDGPLDMRQDRRLGRTAADILVESSEEELMRIFRNYGEEPLAKRLAVAVVQERARQPITRTIQLADLVRRVKRGSHRSIHPATLVFQALRIAVNDELNQLRRGLEAAVELCRPGGRIVVIAFHSLEDRIVKNFMRRMTSPCVCPPGLPVCRCGQQRQLRLVQRKAFQPTEAEVAANPRARSARLRAAEKIEE
ncbi:MAG: 16S rRNA (cytosine(1402)-N(4))-methyltransferase [Verrucomicrobia bacterium GWF2_62_7]|nr:MAG: 16S rRNA (cytosine(1402)-N(4))-methyltransferase [Verrucomicrobia bacterium GWF2_62_7]